jgi:hypothetical protein
MAVVNENVVKIVFTLGIVRQLVKAAEIELPVGFV